MTATQIVLTGLLLLTAVSGFVDFRTGHIPNRLIAVGALLGLVTHFAVHVALRRQPGQVLSEPLRAAGASIALGVLACSAVPLLLYCKSAIGGGDVKLLASVGVWAGPMLGLQVELYAFVLAALYATARLAHQGQLLRSMGTSALLIKTPLFSKAKRKEVPQALLTELRFGPSVFAATTLVALMRWGLG